jgi:hypothetical protein
MEKQEMMEMMERLLATINANQEKMDAKLEKAEADRKTDIKANKKKSEKMTEKMDDKQAKADADRKTYKDMLTKIEANGEAI